MPYYYATASQQSTNAAANTDTLLLNMWTAAAGARAYIQKLMAGTYVTPADNAVRLRLQRATAGTITAGTAVTPGPMDADAPAANAGAATLPTIATPTYSNAVVQLAFNQRGTAMWAAFTMDEAIGLVGAGSSTSINNTSIILNSQSTGTSVPVGFKVIHSE